MTTDSLIGGQIAIAVAAGGNYYPSNYITTDRERTAPKTAARIEANVANCLRSLGYVTDRHGVIVGYKEPQHNVRRKNAVNDKIPPVIDVREKWETYKENIKIDGRIKDNNDLVQLLVENKDIEFSSTGEFEFSRYVMQGKNIFEIVAIDEWGNRSKKTIYIDRKEPESIPSSFDSLNPIRVDFEKNENSVALIIGVSDYESTPNAIYADRDAKLFFDYVQNAFGVPEYQIRLLLDKDASRLSMKRAIKRWLPGLIRKDKTDVYVFFAGHGLASKDGKDLYLLPENGLPDLLEDSAIMRNEIYHVLTEANPRSVTVFLDTCFSGGTRGDTTLVANARNILVAARDNLTPDRFTVFTASAGDEISSILPEAEHGLFSYFLMKGMEGEADYNADKRITAGELHAYVLDHVSRQALRLGRVQTPQLQGDADRVLVKW